MKKPVFPARPNRVHRDLEPADPSVVGIVPVEAQAAGTPISLGNGIYCQEFTVFGTVTYCPCGSCRPEEEYVTLQDCITTTSATQPKLALGEVNASPKPITYYMNNGCGCCRATKACTNQIAITTSIEVTAGA